MNNPLTRPAAEMYRAALEQHVVAPHKALDLLAAILQENPHHAGALELMGALWARDDRHAEALELFRRAAKIQPENASIHRNVGVALKVLGHADAAVDHFQRSLEIDPNSVATWFSLSNALDELGRRDEAAGTLERVLTIDANFLPALTKLAQYRYRGGHFKAAQALLLHASSLAPTRDDILVDLGLAQIGIGDLERGMASYRAALAQNPSSISALNNLGTELRKQGDYAGAKQHFERALALQANNPVLLNSLGCVYLDLYELELAKNLFRQAFIANPGYANALFNFAKAEEEGAHFDSAEKYYRLAAASDANFADPFYHLGCLALLRGDIGASAWAGYERRWGMKNARKLRPQYAQPQWDGSSLAGKTILLHAEQGFGDTLQFVRYAAVVARDAKRVLLDCPARLIKLLSSCDGIDGFIPRGSASSAGFDVYAPLLSVPKLVGTTADTIPAPRGYIRADPQLVAAWRERLGPACGLRVGIAWQGQPSYLRDTARSIALAHFAPLAGLTGLQLVSLQKGYGAEQLKQVVDEWAIVDLSNDLDSARNSFVDTAAVMRNLDLIITSDTAIAHLAGALDVPVWVALAHVPEWRWQLCRSDSPWYPSMRLFRQSKAGDWSTVFSDMRDALSDILASGDRRAMLTTRALPAIKIEIAAGELFDKLAILTIKRERIKDPRKLAKVHEDLHVLEQMVRERIPSSAALERLVEELKTVNEALWQIEDDIRVCEARRQFDGRFIELARAVYVRNDERGRIKAHIDTLLGSRISEQKEYASY